MMRQLSPLEKSIYSKAAGTTVPWCVVQHWPWWYRDYRGFTLAVLILVKDEEDLPVLCHEIHHVKQFNREFIWFWVKYLWYLFRMGYRKHPYEIEARAVEAVARRLLYGK